MTVGLLSVNTIKMKNLTFLTLLLLSFGAVSAQSIADCPSNLSIFAEFAKVKSIWNKVILKEAVTGSAIPIHPGVAKYYKEVGVM